MERSGTVTKNTPSTRDYGTPGLARHFTVIPKLSMSDGYHGKVADDTEVDRLLLTDTIDPMQHSLLIAMFRVLKAGSFVGLRSPDFNAVSAPDPAGLAERKARAVRSVTALFTALDRKVGRTMRCALTDLVLLDKPWPSGLSLADGILALQDIFVGRKRELPRQ